MQHSTVPFSLALLVSHAEDVSLHSFLKDKPHSLAFIFVQDQGRTQHKHNNKQAGSGEGQCIRITNFLPNVNKLYGNCSF